MKKTLVVGNSSFVTLIEDENYYVDKTAFIKAVMESGHFVDLITRPRRFGKTLFMDTLNAFLTMDPETSGGKTRQQAWFKGLKIAEDKPFCEKFLGQFPVIFLSLKGVEGQNFQWAYRSFSRKLVTEAKRHEYLLESPRLSDEEKTMLRNYSSQMFMRELSNLDLAESFLGDMIAMLAKHYEKQVVLLVDEYDVPLARAAERGYFSEMCDLLKAFLDPVKPETGPIVNGRPVLKKAVFTGCLRVSKESIFTGVNNFTANTVCTENDPALAAAMGFTPDEVNEMLRYYDLGSVSDVVKHWYDGYRFGRQEIYSPWDLISFCSKAAKTSDPAARVPENYWTATSGNIVIDEFLGFLSDADADRMQMLVDGGVIEVEINEQLTYADMAFHKSEDFWTLLLFTGYLTVAERLGPKRFLLRIPNEEIRQTFKERVLARYSAENRSFARHGSRLVQSAFSGDVDGMASVLAPLLRTYVSVRDAQSRAPAENYYHGFLSALLASAGDQIQNFKSNIEAGDGYADIVFDSGAGSEKTGVVLEIKRAGRDENMTSVLNSALAQIEEKRYGEIFDHMGCAKYYAYGLVFRGKNCLVGGGTLRMIGSSR